MKTTTGTQERERDIPFEREPPKRRGRDEREPLPDEAEDEDDDEEEEEFPTTLPRTWCAAAMAAAIDGEDADTENDPEEDWGKHKEGTRVDPRPRSLNGAESILLPVIIAAAADADD